MRGVIDTSLTQLNTQVVKLQADNWFKEPYGNIGSEDIVGVLSFNKEFSPTVCWSLKTPKSNVTITSFYARDVLSVLLLSETALRSKAVAVIHVSNAYDVMVPKPKPTVPHDLRQYETRNVRLYLSHADDRPSWSEFVGWGALNWCASDECWEIWADHQLVAFRPEDVLSAASTIGGDEVEISISRLLRCQSARPLLSKRRPKSGHMEYTDPSSFENQRVKLSVRHPDYDNFIGQGRLYWDGPTQTWDVWEARPGSRDKSYLVGAFRDSDVQVIEYVTSEAIGHIYVRQLLPPSWTGKTEDRTEGKCGE